MSGASSSNGGDSSGGSSGSGNGSGGGGGGGFSMESVTAAVADARAAFESGLSSGVRYITDSAATAGSALQQGSVQVNEVMDQGKVRGMDGGRGEGGGGGMQEGSSRLPRSKNGGAWRTRAATDRPRNPCPRQMRDHAARPGCRPLPRRACRE
eukprot:365743-Chlamydomonas_euryale.AAC.13